MISTLLSDALAAIDAYHAGVMTRDELTDLASDYAAIAALVRTPARAALAGECRDTLLAVAHEW